MKIFNPKESTTVYLLPFLSDKISFSRTKTMYYFFNTHHFFNVSDSETDKYIDKILTESFWQDLEKRDKYQRVKRYHYCVLHDDKIKILVKIGRAHV